MYRDRVRLEYTVVEVAWRAGSLEVNRDEGCYEAIRVYAGGWAIVSAPCGKLGDRSLKRIESMARGQRGKLKEAVLYTGVWSSAEKSLIPEERLIEYVEAAAAEMLEYGVTPELILQSYCGRRVIEHVEGRAVHEFCIHEATIAAMRGNISVSDRVAFTSKELPLLPRLARNVAAKAAAAAKSMKALSPLESGRWTLILAGTAAGALYHEISHLLEGDYGARIPRGLQIAPEEVTVRDEPSYPLSPYNHVFDDEGVVAARRTLILEGRVNEYLGTRWSREGKPGAARGLFHPPKAMHTVLIVSRGDWSEREMVEETRRGILVETIHEAHVDSNGVVTIVPELAWLVERGELVSAIRFSRIRLRVGKETRTIDALGKTLWPRLSTEKGHYQVELAPSTRLQAYID